MKLYADYWKETEDSDCKYNDECFIFYKKYTDKSVFIIDAYSKPEIRGQQKMLNFFKELVEELEKMGYNIIFSNSTTMKSGWERSHELQQKFGFIYMGLDNNDETVKNYYYNIKGTDNGKS